MLVGEVEVHIFGAIDSEKYWIICKSEILNYLKILKLNIEDPLILKNYIMNILILIFSYAKLK